MSITFPAKEPMNPLEPVSGDSFHATIVELESQAGLADAPGVGTIVEKLDELMSRIEDKREKRDCLHVLAELCRKYVILPESCKISDVELGEERKFGGVADVWMGKHTQGNVCVKVFRQYKDADQEKFKEALYYRAVRWRYLSHLNLLPFLGVSGPEIIPPFGLVTPRMSGNIIEYTKERQDADRLLLLKEAACGLEYLHSLDIVHGDINPRNILITELGTAQIGDFGIAAVITDPLIAERNMRSRLFHSKESEGVISGWKQDLFRILQIFQTELSMHNHMILLDVRRHVLAGQESTDGKHQPTQASVPVGELPPPAPRACFGRGELIDKVVRFAENLEPIALIGAGGIGKTSIALTVLHDDRIKERFGSNRRFIRCDKFPASVLHFLARLSKVIGAGVENPEDMAPLRPLLSTKKMIIVLDNAESILDPQGPDYQEIYAMVDELCQFKTICVCITSRITTVSRYCKRPPVPTLSMEAACDIFYGIYGDDTRSGIINDLLHRLDFHALSIALLATTALDNMWNHDRLAKEWNLRRAQVLQTDRNESLAATIELSLASPTFSKLGPNARDLLEVVAFFPQGVDERNLDWLFPTITDNRTILDKFCALSLTYRSNGFVTMLAPIKDYLSPRDPKASPLLCTTKDHYFTRLSVHLDPDVPGFGEARWIKSEDVNVEHLLNVFSSIDVDALDVWLACVYFMQHLYWQKPRLTVLKSKIEGLPDDHPSKAQCLFELSALCGLVGNRAEEKRLLTHTLTLQRERGDDFGVAQTLELLSEVNYHLDLPREGIQQAEEALGIFKQLKNTGKQAACLDVLARSLLNDDQLDAAEDATLRSIDLLPEKGQEFRVCQSHRLLVIIYGSKGEKEKAIHHFETALAIASPFNWQTELFWIHEAMAQLFCDEDEFNNANIHISQAKSHTADDPYNLGRAMEMQARIWYSQRGPEDARPEVLGALEIFERLGAAVDVGRCRELLQEIEEAKEGQSSGKSDSGVCSATCNAATENSEDVDNGTGQMSNS